MIHSADLPWWTAADQAELEFRTRLLVERVAGCSDLRCADCRRAIGELCEWRDGRELRSRATFLRGLQGGDLSALHAADVLLEAGHISRDQWLAIAGSAA